VAFSTELATRHKKAILHWVGVSKLSCPGHQIDRLAPQRVRSAVSVDADIRHDHAKVRYVPIGDINVSRLPRHCPRD